MDLFYKQVYSKKMAKKGLDTTFLHYGIRKEDISLIKTLCTEHKLEFDWVKEELLKEFHERKIRNQEIDEKTIENAQYPLIMKQQSINDGVIRDLFGVSGNEFQEIRQAISGLQKGELIIKNPIAIALGMGKKYKKIKISHLI